MTTEHALPTGDITYLFTDIEKSTLLWERHGERMRPVLARHDAILHTAVEEFGGHLVKTTGDGLMAVFVTADSALAAVLEAQRRLNAEPWVEISPDMIRVRMGLHAGQAQLRDGDYYGTAVNRAARIMDLGHGGQVLLSAVTAARLEDGLPPQTTLRDAGDHPLRGLSGNEHIFQLIAPDLESEFPPLRSGQAPAGNLPAHVSSFVGRGREMAEVRTALRRARLLTLSGPGGTGKTRLSLQVAADVQAEYEHGAWFVELAPVTDPALVVTAVAAVFELSGQTNDETRQVLFDYLREKELLLILDNCEHLVEACARLAADLIGACPRLTILASSREGLGVYGEATYHLPTLSLPAGNGLTAETAGQSEAVQLFVERAAAAQAGFSLSDANAGVVAQIVRRLDGIPLAIELAAARLQVFNVDQVAARLDDRFRLLTGGSRTALPRQQTLRALIDWSYDLLDEEERDLFRRLSVFWGGWTFEAAENVGSPLDIYSLLPQLVSKSLVAREAVAELEPLLEDGRTPEPRYFYLETIRQYARDRLIESGQVEEARDRHFAYYEALTELVDYEASSGDARLRGKQVILEFDNLRAAIEWGIDRYPERVLNLFWNLSFYLSNQLPGAEFIDWALSALQRLEALPPAQGEEAEGRELARQKGLVVLGLLYMFLGQLDDSDRVAREAIERLRRTEPDPLILAMALFVRAQAAYFFEDPAVDEYFGESIALLRTMEDRPAKHSMLAMGLMLSGLAEARRGNSDIAERRYDEAISLLQGSDGYALPWAQYSLLVMTMQMGFPLEAVRDQHEKAVAELRRAGSKRLAAMAESDWAHRLRHNGDLEEALAIYRRMLVEWREIGHRAAMANILENIAFVDRAQGRPHHAATMLGAAERIRELIGQDMLRLEREEYEQELAALARDLPEPELETAWTRGRALQTDALIALALESGKPEDTA